MGHALPGWAPAVSGTGCVFCLYSAHEDASVRMGFQALRCEGQPTLHARTAGDDSVHTAQGGHMEFGCFFVGQRPLLHEQLSLSRFVAGAHAGAVRSEPGDPPASAADRPCP